MPVTTLCQQRTSFLNLRGNTHVVILNEVKDLVLEIRFEKLGDGGVASDAVGVLKHIMALILKNQIVGLLSGCLKLLNHIPRLALNDAGIVLALNHQQRASDLLDVGAWRAFQEKLPVALRVADQLYTVGLPGFGDTLAAG